jgi:hypothetical protein
VVVAVMVVSVAKQNRYIMSVVVVVVAAAVF